MLRALFLALFLTLLTAVSAGAQIQQSGPVTGGHFPMWVAPGVVQDAGTATAPATGPAPSTLGLVNNGNNALCISSGPVTGPYQQLCFGVNLSGAAQISLTNLGGATAQGLNFSINGNILSLTSGGLLPACGFTAPGTVPTAPNNTSLFLRGDCTFATPAGGGNTTSPASWTTGDIVTANGNTVVKDSGVSFTNASDTKAPLVHGATTVNDCPKFSDTAGTITDSGSTCGGAVTSIADATNGGLNFSAPTGAVTANIKPSDLLTKSSPTTSDSVIIMDAAASNAAKTSTIPQIFAAITAPQVNQLSGDVLLNNTSNYFDGPSVGQGSTGTWFASGTVTLTDTSGGATIDCKLWDGTTIIASTALNEFSASAPVSAALSGFLATPASNIRISCKDASSTSGKILFNSSGNSKDSSITVFRLQ